jgi:SAM-dependent methyltransferase
MSAGDPDKVERQARHFDSIADTYGVARRHPNHLQFKELMWREFFSHVALPARTPLRVLEAMCGFADGYDILTEFAGVTIRYEGFDYSEKVVQDMCARRPGLKLWREDITRYDPQAGAYDVILVLGGLHHVPDWSADIVGRLASSLRPGGLFISLEPTHGNPLARLVRERIYRRNRLFDAETERAFSVAELEAMFVRAGLEPEHRTYPGLLAYVLYYNPDAFPGLNLGGTRAVNALFALERPFMDTRIGKWLSFATLAAWRSPG